MKKVDIGSFQYTTQLTVDYLNKKKSLKDFYLNFPDIESFENQIQAKKSQFTDDQRRILVEHLDHQYRNIHTTNQVKNNIKSLQDKDTFTVTTGHQLNLFTGPLYFIYKIVSTLDLANQLQEKYPDYHFVPVYWMASEDHDFEEIKSAFLNQKIIGWNQNAGNAVGRMNLNGLQDAIERLAEQLNPSDYAHQILKFLRSDFLESAHYAEAFLKLVDHLFQEFGLVILDADSKKLKSKFTNAIKKDLCEHTLEKTVTQTSIALKKLGYNIQVNPREINLFYFEDKQRKRLIKTENGYITDDKKSFFTEKEILNLVDDHPERFSPNVLMRPLYQETILPNLAYIGGGAEVAYWLQLKGYFDEEQINLPIVFIRNGGMIYNEKQAKKAGKLCLKMEDLLQDKVTIDNQVTACFSDININFDTQIKHLKQQFKDLHQIAHKTDASFYGAVAAQEKKQINGLKHLEKRLLRAEKRKRTDFLKRAHQLQKEFYPDGELQERILNFLAFYQFSGPAFIRRLIHDFNAFDNTFYLIENHKPAEINIKDHS